MADTTSFDRQLADMVWMMTTALRAGYPIRQVFEQLASEAPEPAASACAQVVADLNSGLPLNQALTNWQQVVPSIYLGDVVTAILKHQQTGGNLPTVLEPVGETILGKVGTDTAFLPAMRRLAQSVGASLPQRARES
jgi:tight adherence protein B